MPFTNWSLALALVLPLLVGIASDGLAQVSFLPGESRANSQQYLTSHNSYQGDISLADALDKFNVSSIELDVRWIDNGSCLGGSTGFYVLHHCGDPDGENYLQNYLIQIQNTQRMQKGFFFLNLELDDGYACLGCFSSPSFPSNYLDQLDALLLAAFVDSAIYTWSDFVADGKQWPSIQELVRRGKHMAIHVQKIDGGNIPGGPGWNHIFFGRTASFAANLSDPFVFRNTDDENQQIPDSGDRYMTVRWPEAYCDFEDGNAWGTAFDNGFNFPATNCIDFHAWNNTNFFQPPHPTYVKPAGAVGGLGTPGVPYLGGPGLEAACDRASFYDAYSCTGPACESHPNRMAIELGTGSYATSAAGAVTLDCPVVLTAPDGPVILD